MLERRPLQNHPDHLVGAKWDRNKLWIARRKLAKLIRREVAEHVYHARRFRRGACLPVPIPTSSQERMRPIRVSCEEWKPQAGIPEGYGSPPEQGAHAMGVLVIVGTDKGALLLRSDTAEPAPGGRRRCGDCAGRPRRPAGSVSDVEGASLRRDRRLPAARAELSQQREHALARLDRRAGHRGRHIITIPQAVSGG